MHLHLPKIVRRFYSSDILVVDETIMLFGIHLMIILSQIKISLAQQCTVSCTQVAVLRNMPYEEIFETIENREWENEEDFGADLLDLIRRHKRVKRAIVGETISMTRLCTLKPSYNKPRYNKP